MTSLLLCIEECSSIDFPGNQYRKTYLESIQSFIKQGHDFMQTAMQNVMVYLLAVTLNKFNLYSLGVTPNFFLKTL